MKTGRFLLHEPAARSFQLIGSGEEGLVYRKGRLVIKRLYTEKKLQEVQAIQAQARTLIANPELEAAWPIDYISHENVVFMIQRYVPGCTAAEIMAARCRPESPVARRIYDDRDRYWNNETINSSFLGRLVGGGKTVEEAIADGHVVYDYGSENFRIHEDRIVVVDVSFLGRPRVAQELRDSTSFGRQKRISILRERYRTETEKLLSEMEEMGRFDQYDHVQPETRIAVVGNSGSGKSTLSAGLAARLGLPHMCIDNVLWLPDWKQSQRLEFNATHNEWITRSDWIIDGIGHWPELESRLKRATHIIHVDLSVERCIEQAHCRIEDEAERPDPHITPGCTYADARELQIQVIHDYHNQTRPQILDTLNTLDVPTLTITQGGKPKALKQALGFICNSRV